MQNVYYDDERVTKIRIYVIDWSGAMILVRESHRKTTNQGIGLHMQAGQLYEQRRGSLRPSNDL